MPRKRRAAEETIGKLRVGEVGVGQGVLAVEAIRRTGMTEQSHWRVNYKGVEWISAFAGTSPAARGAKRACETTQEGPSVAQ